MECLDCDTMCHDNGNTGCSLGYYLNNGACTICPAGYMCDGTLQKPCAPGYYAASTGSAACSLCYLGTYSNTPASTACTAASAGNIVNLPYIGQFPCYRGTYPNANFTACISCPAGTQCDNPSSPTNCTKGYFCNPVGIYQSSANNQQPCPSGYYNNLTGSTNISDCIPCVEGGFCPKASSANITCPVGHYCPSYSFLPDNAPCPIGTFNNLTGMSNISSCTQCPEGSYCLQGAANKYPCIDGYYCPAGSNYPF